MRVLVTGGYGFIGSHVAEKFYQEGHTVFIIDNLTSGKAENVSCEHKFYKIDVEDKKCERVFRNNSFDIVVHLAAQINVSYSFKDPFMDAKSNILGLVNMLELSAKYKVKKFIFASSAAVYGNNPGIPLKEKTKCNPLSPYGISKLLGEQYCVKWSEFYGLETVCLRFSNVYGPRQGLVGEGGVISIFMERLIKNQELIVYGDGKQTRDFIYVLDVTEVIFRAAQSHITGVYNLSTNVQNSINDLIYALMDIQSPNNIVYQAYKAGDIINSCLDNTKIRRALKWIPKYEFEEGVNLTYKWYSQNSSKLDAYAEGSSVIFENIVAAGTR